MMKIPILLKATKNSIAPIHKKIIDKARKRMSKLLLGSRKIPMNAVMAGKTVTENVRNVVGVKNLIPTPFKYIIIPYRNTQSD